MFELTSRMMMCQNQEPRKGTPWTASKKHFRESEEWRKKKRRVYAKMKAMGRINLALIMTKLPLKQRLDKRSYDFFGLILFLVSHMKDHF
ncbi:unnamed protein product [Thelazia callipaeda]|uniref:BHLH domain-containing protein n=1 Tax=Thelazia callipaeda TaxID=103827 RepID=A0A0N5CU42_THECL|nr:unnamed protein product [Thelazia callipaeda]